jgi:phospholipid/cholesterol/gamma-HCH transport system ATP-binding protein
MIRVRNLTVGYGDAVVLEDVSFEVARGRRFAILGGSGCGKTTLLRHVIGLLEPMAGTVEIDVPVLAGGGEQAPGFGVTFQDGALFGSMTLLENVSLPLEKWTLLQPDAVRAVALARLRLVGLEGFENHLPAELSGGMKKRGGIARALALDPPLLFLDEPSAGLDPVTSVELDDLMITLNEALGMTIVLVSHELPSIFKVAQECIVLDKDAKGIVARGDPRELRDNSVDDRVRRFFHRLSRAG